MKRSNKDVCIHAVTYTPSLYHDRLIIILSLLKLNKKYVFLAVNLIVLPIRAIVSDMFLEIKFKTVLVNYLDYMK